MLIEDHCICSSGNPSAWWMCTPHLRAWETVCLGQVQFPQESYCLKEEDSKGLVPKPEMKCEILVLRCLGNSAPDVATEHWGRFTPLAASWVPHRMWGHWVPGGWCSEKAWSRMLGKGWTWAHISTVGPQTCLFQEGVVYTQIVGFSCSKSWPPGHGSFFVKYPHGSCGGLRPLN